MPPEFDWSPRIVSPVQTRFRRISSPFPPPEAVPMLETLACYEPRALRSAPPVLWDRAEGFEVSDPWGNRWIDWSSARETGPVAASGDARLRLVERLAGLLPDPLVKILLLSTGSDAVHCAIELCRLHGFRQGGRTKHIVLSFRGDPPAADPGLIRLPYPDGFRSRDVTFESFQARLRELGVEGQSVAGVILESCQASSGAFAPPPFVQALRTWASGHKALLVADEAVIGFARTGKLFAFEHYGVVPDLAILRPGPLAALAGRSDALDLLEPTAFDAIETATPLSCAAALASLERILAEDLCGRAREAGDLLHSRLGALASRTPQIGNAAGRGLFASLACIQRGTHETDESLAFDIVRRAVEKGVLLSGPKAGAIRIAPPLTIATEALEESLAAFEQAVAEAVA